MIQRYNSSIHFGADRPVPNLCMNPEGKIERHRTSRKLYNLTFGCKNKHEVREKVHLQRFNEFLRILGFMLQLQNLAEKRHPVLRIDVIAAAFLVSPVSRNPELGSPVHLPRADLHFCRLSARTHHSGVQRLVHVRFGHGNIILETARHRLPKSMNNPECGITILNIVDDNADGKQIINFIELLVLGVHLVIDTVNMLRTPGQIPFDPHFVQFGTDAADHAVDELFPFRPLLVDQVGNAVILLRVQITEGNILHLPFNRGNPQTVRNGTKNLQRFIRNTALAFFGLIFKGTHIVQAVRQLNHNHPDILSHSDEHFAVVLVLLLFLGAEANAFQLG
ncbi:hypothetical protein D3C75_783240 [compost metagenome]